MSTMPSFADAIDLLRLFQEQGLTRDQLLPIRSSGIIADICNAARLGHIEKDYCYTRRYAVRLGLGTVGFLPINRSKQFEPSVDIGSDWSIWLGRADGDGHHGEEQQDARSLALHEVNFAERARFLTCLADDKSIISGEDRLARLYETNCIRADANIGWALFNEPNQLVLRWIYETFKITWFELPGTILRTRAAIRYHFCLNREHDGRWTYGCGRLVDERDATKPALVITP